MPREFDGTTSYTLTGTPGSLVGMDAGPITLAAIVKLTSTSTDGALIYCGGGAESGVDLELFGGSYYMGSSDPALATASTSDGWHLVAATKAAGTATPRFHKYVISTATWTHTDAGSTMTDGVTVGSGDTLQMGRWGGASMRINGAIQIAAVWDRVLSDAEIELLPFAVQAWYASAPKEGWLLDQADTTTSIVSFTGGGANFTGGAALVSTDSGPGLSYGFNVEAPTSVTAAAGTNANAGNAAGTGTANSTSIAEAANGGSAASTAASNLPGPATKPNAGSADATVVANSAAASLHAGPTAAAGTGAANSPTATSTANPAAAGATGASNNPTAAAAIPAGASTTTGAANNPTIDTSASTSAPAGLAAATGAGSNPSVAAAAQAVLAAAAVVVNQAALSIAATPSAAAAAGVANNAQVPTGSLSAFAGRATGSGAAWNPPVSRPNTGTVSRPGSGNITRPFTGIVVRP